ncbi:MAG: hypothetical protein C0485_19620 [Pirellula sp.]|nr:hypothetical protein [Pirellula sp.]
MDDVDPTKWRPAERAPNWRLRQACDDATSRKLRLEPSARGEMRRAAMCAAELYGAGAQQREAIRQDGRFCDYAEVLDWYFNRDQGAQIEALVLARMTSAYIAQQLGIAPEAVDRYCTLCFDVQSQLDDSAYILREAITSERRLGNPATSQRRTTMKLLAYYCGPQVLIDLYGVGATKEAWVHPTEHIRWQTALTAVDRSVARLISADAGEPLRSEEVEACLAAIDPYLSKTYAATKNDWLRKPRSGEPAPPAKAARKADARCPKPSPLIWYPQKHYESECARVQRLRREWELPNAENLRFNMRYWDAAAATHLESLRLAAKWHAEALEVRQSFLDSVATRAAVPAGWFDGPGIAANWNVDVFDSSGDVADWALRQIEEVDADSLIESMIFVQEGSQVRLADAIAAADSPIVIARDCVHGTPTSVFAGEWDCASSNPLQGFIFCQHSLISRARHGGVVIAAANSREAAAWRRLGLAAIPVPVKGIWPAVAKTFWQAYAYMCREPDPSVQMPKNRDQQFVPPPAILTVSSLDPTTLTSRPNVESGRLACSLRAMWDRYCGDPAVCVGLWLPSERTIASTRAAIAGQSAVTLDACIQRSLEAKLSFLVARKRMRQAPLSRRQTMATMEPDAPLAHRDKLFQQFMDDHEGELVQPLLNESASSESPIDRVRIAAIAGLTRRLGEIDADLILHSPARNGDLKNRTILRSEYLKVASVLTSAITTAKGGSRARKR